MSLNRDNGERFSIHFWNSKKMKNRFWITSEVVARCEDASMTNKSRPINLVVSTVLDKNVPAADIASV